MERFICDKCKLQYRYESDFEEHNRVGCRMKSAKKNAPTFSDKDVESVEEQIAESISEAVAEPKPSKKK